MKRLCQYTARLAMLISLATLASDVPAQQESTLQDSTLQGSTQQGSTQQGPAPQNSKSQDSAAQQLTRTLRRLGDSELRASATVAEKKMLGEADNKMLTMAVSAMSEMLSSKGVQKSFAGDIEVYRSPVGTLSAATAGALPIKLMKDGERQLFSQMHTGEMCDSVELLDLLEKTLDFHGLADEVSRAKRVRRTTSDGSTVYRVTLDGEYFEEREEDDSKLTAMIVTSSFGTTCFVMEAVMTLTIDASGAVSSLGFVILEHDPMKASMNQAFKSGGPAGGRMGGAAITLGGGQANDEDITEPTRKVAVDYTLHRETNGVAKMFLDEARQILASEDAK